MKPLPVATVVASKLLLLFCVPLGLLLWQPTSASAQGPDVTANSIAAYQEGIRVTPLLSTSENTIGQALAEAVETPHNAFNAGTEPVKLVVFVLGAKGLPFTVRLFATLQRPATA
jgi:hypothetical protein